MQVKRSKFEAIVSTVYGHYRKHKGSADVSVIMKYDDSHSYVLHNIQEASESDPIFLYKRYNNLLFSKHIFCR